MEKAGERGQIAYWNWAFEAFSFEIRECLKGKIAVAFLLFWTARRSWNAWNSKHTDLLEKGKFCQNGNLEQMEKGFFLQKCRKWHICFGNFPFPFQNLLKVLKLNLKNISKLKHLTPSLYETDGIWNVCTKNLFKRDFFFLKNKRKWIINSCTGTIEIPIFRTVGKYYFCPIFAFSCESFNQMAGVEKSPTYVFVFLLLSMWTLPIAPSRFDLLHWWHK